MSSRVSERRRQDDGYTLSEMLVALMILGLAMGGVMQATALLGHLQADTQRQVARFEARRALQTRFAQMFDHAGPFRSSGDRFEGDARALRFGCGASQCEARLDGFGDAARLRLQAPQSTNLSLSSADTPRFEYVGSVETGDEWPSQGHQPQRLMAVRLVAGQGRSLAPLATALVWRQEEPNCQFDTIAKDCRGGAQ